MEVHFTPEQEARLAEVAARTGTDPASLVKDAALQLLRGNTSFQSAVLEALARADHGDFVEEEIVDPRHDG